MKCFPRFLSAQDESFFLFGPRGTGKTLWLRQTFPKALHLDLLSPADAYAYNAQPDRLREVVLGQKSKIIVIDEIQRAPDLLNVIHGMIVDFPDLRFVMTGSSTCKLHRRGVNLLGGRACLRTMHPFMAAELGTAFDFERALRHGMLPLIHGRPKPKTALQGYVGTYLGEEVKREGMVRRVDTFACFLEAASLSHGNTPNMALIASECFVSQPTVANYFQILRDLLLSFSVPVFSKRAKRNLLVRDKFYFWDVGVYQAIRPKGFLGMDEELVTGMALEGLVAQHLRAWCDYSDGAHKLHHWRTISGLEVDFVVYGESSFAAFEVKLSKTIRDDHLRGLRAFGEDYPEAQLCLIYGGTEARLRGNVLCLPCEAFLRELCPNALVPEIYSSVKKIE
ncbi:MAG: AAA family ATPase [Puniceicoccales bacterium]|jgi:predicted AAA+ superfamily ATPase|nr:AAA family ATPase [Puniceicoccales bacterium]